MGKCFLDKKGYKEKTSTTDTDCKGLLNIIINDQFIHSFIDEPIDPPNDTFSKIKSARNEVLHSSSLAVTDDTLYDIIENMIRALTDKKCLKESQQSENAIQKLSLLKSDKFVISNMDEMEIRESALSAIREAKTDAIEALEDKQAEIIQTIQVDELKGNVEKLRQSIASLNFKQDNTVLRLQSLTSLEAKHTKTEEDLSSTKEKLTSMTDAHNTLEAETRSVSTAVNTLSSVNSRLDSIEVKQRVLDADVASIKDIQENVLSEIKQIQNDILKFKMKSNEDDKTERFHQQKIAYLKKKTEFQYFLCDLYEKYLSTIPVSPVLEEIDARIEDIYVSLTITDDLARQSERDQRTVPREVNGYVDILTKNDKLCKNVYVIGDAGIGKTTWCMKVLRAWTLAQKNMKNSTITTTAMSSNENFLSDYFDVVLFVSLRLASNDYNICDMIQNQLFEEYPDMYEFALDIMRNEPERCLLVCDGLDEWIPQQAVVNRSPLYTADLPGRKNLNGAIVVTTTRPWKLDNIRLSDRHIDRSVTIEGFSTHRKVMTLATKLIEHFNMKNSERPVITRNVTDFENDLKASFRLTQGLNKPTILRTPLLLTYVVCKWYDSGQLGGNIALNHMNIFEFLFDHFERKYNIQNIQQDIVITKLPCCIKNRPSCLRYTVVLEKLAFLAFKTLISEDERSKLVFTREEINQFLSDDELAFSTKTGILSQSRAVGKTLTKLSKLTFLHKSIQEFLCALHVVYETANDRTGGLDVLSRNFRCKKKLGENENVILFISGLDRKSGSALSEHLADIVDSELEFNNNRVPTTSDLFMKCDEEFVKNDSDSLINNDHVIRTHTIYFGRSNSTELLKRMDSLFEHNKNKITHLDMTISFQHGGRNELQRQLSFFRVISNIPSAVSLKMLKIENIPVSTFDIGRHLICFKELIHLE